MLQYPAVDDIVVANQEVLREIKVRKADQHKVLSTIKIEEVLDSVKAVSGDVYDKAVVMLKGLVQAHPFASGNWRTAFICTQDFILVNKGKMAVRQEENAYILQGIREDYYSNEEIKMWLKEGKIHEFKR